MYTVNVEPLSDITPRMDSCGFENSPGGLGTTAIILADNPVVGCKSIDSALAGNGKLLTIQPNPILPGSLKEATK